MNRRVDCSGIVKREQGTGTREIIAYVGSAVLGNAGGARSSRELPRGFLTRGRIHAPVTFARLCDLLPCEKLVPLRFSTPHRERNLVIEERRGN